jgi:hypothetical protein
MPNRHRPQTNINPLSKRYNQLLQITEHTDEYHRNTSYLRRRQPD